MKEKANKKKKSLALNPVILLVMIVVIAAIATYIVPAGLYDRVEDAATGRMIVDPNSFHYVDKTPVSFFDTLKSVTLGLQKGSDVIFFLMIIGGMFQVMNATGAISVGVSNIVKKMKGREILMIPVLMTVFGCGSAFAANFEEWLAFVPLVLMICIAMGFDSMTACGIILCAAAAGYGGGVTNAFTTGVAQGIAGLPMFSGMGLRMALFITLLIVSIIYVTRYAMKIKKDPTLSPVHEQDKLLNVDLDLDNIPKLTRRQIGVLITFAVTMIFMVYGIIKFGFYIDELAALFLLAGIIAGLIGGFKPGKIADEFLVGFSNMVFPGVVIGLCNGAVLLMQNANLMDTVIHALAGLLNGLPATICACGMFVIQDLFNVLVSSGSGQAAITMPLMAPLADILGITRQTAVMAFHLGDAFTNVYGPTGGTLLAALAMTKVPYGKWMKWLTPLFFLWWVVAFAFLIIAVQTGYGPF